LKGVKALAEPVAPGGRDKDEDGQELKVKSQTRDCRRTPQAFYIVARDRIKNIIYAEGAPFDKLTATLGYVVKPLCGFLTLARAYCSSKGRETEDRCGGRALATTSGTRGWS